MKKLDELVEGLKKLTTPIIVKKKEYDGGNPFIIQIINHLLFAKELKLADIEYDKKRITLDDDGYLVYPEFMCLTGEIEHEHSELVYRYEQEKLRKLAGRNW